ncbi:MULTISPECIES: ABC transporter ATP-binding protein [unclassified Neisseria]|uniref:ABC transporter ATP-binding protein n=1 Tax=unclassified Neisseria TaxID=2623750 RepID=UPI0026670369|nr:MULTISPECIES: ABC transporter ATP-binding protein [unclassified Neisseria]MDO1510964.1 ABC transporter ATP-binding protein [Neisseria sp. MVDL19-042950]MDO1517223.1 ABC transporter ATP-binding protein [Neisseria sp. MVDL18-041461]MDO1564586.1 ABC transporter ATP-binding protein [Neisseria sp. MVDL20-010259]
MSAAIHIQNAVKTYQNGFTALKDVSFNVEQGEFFGLLGPNGAGKTTLISAMAGLSRLTSGSISVMGHDVVADAYAARMSLGVVPQELVFDPFFTVREALQFQSGYFGIKNNDVWIDEIIDNLGLADKADTNTRNLSGGMKRRLMVAQALVHRPPVIVLDEPTAGVDVELRQNLWTFISGLNRQGHTIILTTHYLEEAQSMCARIAMLKHGELVALDETEHLLHNEKGLRVALLLGGALPENLQQWRIPQENDAVLLKLEDYDQLAFVLQTLKYAGVEVKHLSLPETDLEDVFVQMMRAK